MPTTTNDIFDAIADRLAAFAAWTKTSGLPGAQFHRARDPFEVLELLGNGPGFRIIALWIGDEPAGSGQRSNVVRSRFTVTLSANRGLPVARGAGQTTERHDGAPSLMEHVADIQCLLLHHTDCGENTSTPLKYDGCEPVRYEGAMLDAYELRFSLFAALPDTDERPRVTAFLDSL
jgi:hypothetical protein